jgi:hypothetical protein
MYIENPKTRGSGILCAIPQTGTCPVKCSDCFFQSGRSYLEPLQDNLPNLPSREQACGKIVRMNDGNDSNIQKETVLEAAKQYKDVFFNTSVPKLDFPGPVVLTVNPAGITDVKAHLIYPVPINLMFVRFRTNMWNQKLCDEVIMFYTPQEIPVVLTFMAYYTLDVPEEYKHCYEFKKRTLNSYWVLKEEYWNQIINKYQNDRLVYTCGKTSSAYSCSHCGNCIREYFNTKTLMSQNI